MCKKTYELRMDEFLNAVAFRVTLFSLPQFRGTFVNLLVQKFPEIKYQERPLGQYEGQLIDIDSIAAELDVPITNLIEQKIYVLDSIKVGNQECRIYVSPYYVFVYLPLQENKEIPDSIGEEICGIIGIEMLENAQVQTISCITNHYLNIKPGQIFSEDILDPDAFPQFYPTNIETGRYSDSHLDEKEHELTLIRDITRGIDVETQEEYLNINLTSIASTHKVANEEYQKLYDLALEEVARCFK